MDLWGNGCNAKEEMNIQSNDKESTEKKKHYMGGRKKMQKSSS